jgi:transposase
MDRARAALADLTALDRTALEALIVAQQTELSTQQEKLHNRDSEIEHLKLVIARLRRMMFGTKSEKVTR